MRNKRGFSQAQRRRSLITIAIRTSLLGSSSPFPSYPSKSPGPRPFKLQLQVRDEHTLGPAGPCSPAAPGCPCGVITVKWVGKAGCENTRCPRGRYTLRAMEGLRRPTVHLGSSHQTARFPVGFGAVSSPSPETSLTPRPRSSSSEFEILGGSTPFTCNDTLKDISSFLLCCR